MVRLGFAFVLLASVRGAHAQDLPRVELHYGAPASCPGVSEFRDRVAAQVGMDAFVDEGELTLRVEIDRSSEGYRASIGYAGEDFDARRIGPLTTCAELLAAVVMTTAIVIDPLGAAGTAGADPGWTAPPEPKPTPALVPDPGVDDERPPPPPIETDPIRILFEGTLDLGVSAGSTPNPALFISAGVGIAPLEALRVELGARLRHGLVAISLGAQDLRIAIWSIFGGPCWQTTHVSLCATGELGQSLSELSSLSQPETRLHAAAGLELSASGTLGQDVGLRATLGAQGVFTRIRVFDREVARFQSEWFAVGATLGVYLLERL
jgi:hypothetical protein